MRYAIFYTPSASEALTLAASSWLGRSVYSGEPVEHPVIRGLSHHEIAFHTALPRRYGFHAELKAPFRLHPDRSEAQLLRDLMQFAGSVDPFVLPRLTVVRLGDHFALVPADPCAAVDQLAASVVQHFDAYRAPLSEAELERLETDRLTAPQFSNLLRWGSSNVMGEFRFRMALTGPIDADLRPRFEHALHGYFGALLTQPPTFDHLALFVEKEPGAPLQVHSLHPMGRVSARRIA